MDMLAKFAVKNYLGFPERIEWDLTKTRDYAFNPHLVHNGIVKDGIIYGINGSGKSSLGKAIFDIVGLVHNPVDYRKAIYQGNPDGLMDFEYSFIFDVQDTIDYRYSKNSQGFIVKESMYHCGQEVFFRDGAVIRISPEFSVDKTMLDKLATSANSVSLVKFIFSSFPIQQGHYLQKLMTFVGSMLWFRCLDERNYIGIDNALVNIEEYIISQGYIDDFAKFLLDESGQEFDLSSTGADDKYLVCRIGNTLVPFGDIISTGTRSLELLFYWTKRMAESQVQFVFIDEFDAFYHFELSINVCNTLFKQGFQVFLSSHNTMLLGNDFLRPDCAFYLRNNRMDALCDCTDRGELRQGHNIEKMYRAGAFDDR